MKLTLSLLTTAFAALVAAESNATPALFDLRVANPSEVLPGLIWNNLMFYNGTRAAHCPQFIQL